MAEANDDLELGGNIVLSGFKEIDGGTMIILKKIVGNYARKVSEHSSGFQRLVLTMKKIHEVEGSKKYELHARVEDSGKVHASEVVERNIFVAVDSALKKIEHSLFR